MTSVLGDATLRSHHPSASIALYTRPRFGALLRLMAAVAFAADAWTYRQRQLRALVELDEHLLRDLGLSRDDVARACGKRFRSE
jgi:uncharacterized protein YjiS (DUF1127 family)